MKWSSSITTSVSWQYSSLFNYLYHCIVIIFLHSCLILYWVKTLIHFECDDDLSIYLSIYLRQLSHFYILLFINSSLCWLQTLRILFTHLRTMSAVNYIIKNTAEVGRGGFRRLLMTLYVYVWWKISVLLQQASKGSRRPSLRCHRGAVVIKPLAPTKMQQTRNNFC